MTASQRARLPSEQGVTTNSRRPDGGSSGGPPPTRRRRQRGGRSRGQLPPAAACFSVLLLTAAAGGCLLLTIVGRGSFLLKEEGISRPSPRRSNLLGTCTAFRLLAPPPSRAYAPFIKKKTASETRTARTVPSALSSSSMRDSQDAGIFRRHDGGRVFLHASLADPDKVGQESMEGNEEVEEPRTRNVRFISPLLEYGYRPAVDEWYNGTAATKPMLLYLPGFDGTYLSPFLQFPELGTLFDVRCMVVSMDDRSTFQELKDEVLAYVRGGANDALFPPPMSKRDDDGVESDTAVIDSQKSVDAPATSRIPFAHVFGGGGGGGRPTNATTTSSTPLPTGAGLRPPRPLYLAGESFGGILAVEVATALLEEDVEKNKAATASATVDLRGLALINAATCYDRSRLAALGPAVAEYHPWLYPLGLIMQLVPLFTDEHSLQQLLLILRGIALPSIIDDAAREAYLGRVALSLPFVVPVMTQAALRWRLHEWLAVGCDRMVNQDRVSNLAKLLQRNPKSTFKVLVVAGENDAALPSIAEAERLASVLPGALVHVVEGAGHASTCGSRVDLAALFRKCYPDDLLRMRHGQNGAPESSSPTSSSNSVLWQWTMNRASSAGRTKDGSVFGRTEMKPVAAAGVNEYFGMEPRYDNATIGLSPLLYWSSKYYRKYEPTSSPSVQSSTKEAAETDSSHDADASHLRPTSKVAEAEQLTFSSAVPDAANKTNVVN